MKIGFRVERLFAQCAISAFALFIGTALHAQAPLKVGVLVPLTGNNAADGSRMLRSHELAAREINESGALKNLGGAKIELVIADTQSKPEVSRSEAEKLINRAGVSAVIGALGSATTIPAMQVAERAKIPFMISTAVADNLTEQGFKNIFRVSPKGKWAADNAFDFLAFLKAKGIKVGKLALAYEDGPYGQSVAKNYDVFLSAKGYDIVAKESFRTGSSDLNTQVAKLKASGADAVLIVSYVDDEIVLLRTMAAQQFKPIVIGYGGGHVNQVLLKLGEVVEGSFGIVEWSHDVNKASSLAYVKAHEAAYKGETPLSNSAQAYVSTWAVALAANAAASTEPQKIRDALATINIPTGPGTVLPADGLRFDASGQLAVRNVVVQIQNGKFVTVFPETVAAGKAILSRK